MVPSAEHNWNLLRQPFRTLMRGNSFIRTTTIYGTEAPAH